MPGRTTAAIHLLVAETTCHDKHRGLYRPEATRIWKEAEEYGEVIVINIKQTTTHHLQKTKTINIYNLVILEHLDVWNQHIMVVGDK